MPKEDPWQAVGRLKSLEGADRNVCASRAWKGGNMKLDFWTAPFFVTVLFLFPLVALFKLRRNLANSLKGNIFDSGGKCEENKFRHTDFAALPPEGGRI